MNTVIFGTSFLTGSLKDSHVSSCHHSGNSSNGFPCASSLSSFLVGFSISAGPCDRFPCTSTLVLSLHGFAGCTVGDEDVGEVDELEVEELVDRPGTTNGTDQWLYSSVDIAEFEVIRPSSYPILHFSLAVTSIVGLLPIWGAFGLTCALCSGICHQRNSTTVLVELSGTLDSRLFSAGASILPLVLEFWCVPSTPRGCDGPSAVTQ